MYLTFIADEAAPAGKATEHSALVKEERSRAAFNSCSANRNSTTVFSPSGTPRYHGVCSKAAKKNTCGRVLEYSRRTESDYLDIGRSHDIEYGRHYTANVSNTSSNERGTPVSLERSRAQ